MFYFQVFQSCENSVAMQTRTINNEFGEKEWKKKEEKNIISYATGLQKTTLAVKTLRTTTPVRTSSGVQKKYFEVCQKH